MRGTSWRKACGVDDDPDGKLVCALLLQLLLKSNVQRPCIWSCHTRVCFQYQPGRACGPVADILSQWCHHFPSEGAEAGQQAGKHTHQQNRVTKSFTRGVPGSKHHTHSWLNTVSSFSQTNKPKNESGSAVRLKSCLAQTRRRSVSAYGRGDGAAFGLTTSDHITLEQGRPDPVLKGRNPAGVSVLKVLSTWTESRLDYGPWRPNLDAPAPEGRWKTHCLWFPKASVIWQVNNSVQDELSTQSILLSERKKLNYWLNVLQHCPFKLSQWIRKQSAL